MRISEILTAMANWLENPENEAILLAEYDDNCLKVVAGSCVEAANCLRKAAGEVDKIEPPAESKITVENVEKIAEIATAFDSSGDEELKKIASVFDELLLTIASPKQAAIESQMIEDNRIEELKKKYQGTKKSLDELNKISETEEAIKKSKMTQETPKVKILEQSLQTRTCIDHPGAQLARVGEGMWQCDLDKKIYSWQNGFQLLNGDKVPGGDVSNQTKIMNVYGPSHVMFDSRNQRLNSNKA